MPRASRLRARPVSSSRVRSSTSGPGRVDVRRLHELVDRGGAERARRARRRSARAAAPSMSARSSSSVSNSVAAFASSSSSGGSTRSLISLTTTVALRRRAVGELVRDLALLAGAEAADAVLDLLDEPLRAELDDVVALRRAVLRERGRRRRCRRRRAGRPSTGIELGDGALQRLELGLRPPPRGTSASCFGTSSVVQSAGSGFGCTSTVAEKRQSSSSLVGSSYSYSGCATGLTRARVGGVPEPAADVALDRLGVEALACRRAAARIGIGTLPLRKPGMRDGRGEVVGGVLDGVVHVVRRHLDRQLDLVVRELFDLCAPSVEPLNQTGTVRRPWTSSSRHPQPPDAQAVRRGAGRRGDARASSLELARYAPNHHLTQPWRFRVLGPETRRAARRRLRREGGDEAAPRADARARDGGAVRRPAHRRGGSARDRVRASTRSCSARPSAGSRPTGARRRAFASRRVARRPRARPTTSDRRARSTSGRR